MPVHEDPHLPTHILVEARESCSVPFPFTLRCYALSLDLSLNLELDWQAANPSDFLSLPQQFWDYRSHCGHQLFTWLLGS